MSTIQIAVHNVSDVVGDDEVRAAIPALRRQVHEHFYPAWGTDAHLTFVPRRTDPSPDSWWLTIVDDADQAQWNGYHDVTPSGMPLAKVFTALVKPGGGNWTVTASHELLEMLADPDVNRMVVDPVLHLNSLPKPGEKTGVFYFLEVCDPCSDDRYAYKMGGTAVWVSDFVLPAWFQTFRKHGTTKFDHMGHIDAPLKHLPGGYVGVFDAEHGWQLNGESDLPAHLRHPLHGSRRERRRRARSQWKPSLSAAHRPTIEQAHARSH